MILGMKCKIYSNGEQLYIDVFSNSPNCRCINQMLIKGERVENMNGMLIILQRSVEITKEYSLSVDGGPNPLIMRMTCEQFTPVSSDIYPYNQINSPE